MMLRTYSLKTFCRVASFLCVPLAPMFAQSTEIHGVVRNLDRQPVPDASIVLRCKAVGTAAAERTTVSDVRGLYNFTGVTRSLCTLQASSVGLTANVELDLTARDVGNSLQPPDLVLRPPTSQSEAPTPAATPAPQPPTFEASGIRGLIDPGGYSAPAEDAAAASLMSGMADLRRAEPGADVQPCVTAGRLLQAVHDNPGSAEAYRKVAEFYLRKGEPDAALPYLDSARKAAPGDQRISLDSARVSIAQEKFEQARSLLQAMSPDAHDVQREVLLAKAEEGIGLFMEASVQYHLAVQLDANVENIFGEGYELVLAARLPLAEQVFQKGLQQFPNAVRLLIGKGIAEYLEGRSATSVSTLLAATAVDPGDAQPYPFLTQAYLVSGERSDVVRSALRNHLARSPNDADAYYLFALALSRVGPASTPGDDAEVETLLRKSITLKPALVQAHFRLGILLARQSKNEPAAAEFEQALVLQPTLVEAHFRLAQVDRKLNRTDAATREMASFRNMRPSGDAHEDSAQIDLRPFISVIHPSVATSSIADCR